MLKLSYITIFRQIKEAMTNQFPFKRSQLAISLIELLLSLAVISALLVMGVRYFESVQYQQKVNRTATMVRDIISAANAWGTSYPDYSTISIPNLVNLNLLPNSYNRNPWGGDVTIGQSSDNIYNFTITLTGLSPEACKALQSQFSDYSIGC